MQSVLLSTAYFPPIYYFSKIIQSQTVTIEKEENFLKQTYRNRCVLLAANGPLNLTIPVKHGMEPKIPIKEVLISYETNWQKIHLRAIESAYRNSPYYEYYIDEFIHFFKGNYDTLLGFNTEILRVILDLLKFKGTVEYTNCFNPASENDYRYSISPKIELQKIVYPEYNQVFIEKFGFISNLTILDLIFNVGPESNEILQKLK